MANSQVAEGQVGLMGIDNQQEERDNEETREERTRENESEMPGANQPDRQSRTYRMKESPEAKHR